MKPPPKKWIENFLLIALGVCLFLPVYIIDRKYAHAATSKTLFDSRSETKGNSPEKYNNTLPDKTSDRSTTETHNQRQEAAMGKLPDNKPSPPDPEIYFRRKMVAGNWMLGLFLVPLLGGLITRRWVASVMIIILGLFTWYVQGLKY